jgi:hypothetical protein
VCCGDVCVVLKKRRGRMSGGGICRCRAVTDEHIHRLDVIMRMEGMVVTGNRMLLLDYGNDSD